MSLEYWNYADLEVGDIFISNNSSRDEWKIVSKGTNSDGIYIDIHNTAGARILTGYTAGFEKSSWDLKKGKVTNWKERVMIK